LAKPRIREEQLYGVAADPNGGFWLGGRRVSSIPWMQLRSCHLFSADDDTLEAMLTDAVRTGYQVLSGTSTGRRGLRAFVVAIGAWGCMGRIECRTCSSWAIEPPERAAAETRADLVERSLRALCRRLNEEVVPFSASSTRWLGAVVRRQSHPMEPDGYPAVLPPSVADLCRAAHVGGPIVHARTTLAPYVSIDRRRAYGDAMLGKLPVGSPSEINVPKDGSPVRWRPNDLMSAAGIAEAVISLEPGAFLPLMPLFQPHVRAERSRVCYPTGRFRGMFTLEELAAFERSGKGRVEKLYRVITFQQAPVMAPVVKTLRKLEAELDGIKVKSLEHVLYGRCARGLTFTRLGSVPVRRDALARDLLDDRSAHRVRGRIRLEPYPLRHGDSIPLGHTVYRAVGRLMASSERGAVDRPDRSAVITARNRVAMGDLIDRLDVALRASRSGDFVGRVYVDGVDIEANVADIPPIEGISIKSHGPMMRVVRSNVVVRCDARGKPVEFEGGPPRPFPDIESFIEQISRDAERDSAGPFTAGRIWMPEPDGRDPRDLPERCSEPPHVDLKFGASWRAFGDGDEPEEEA
jgi:hypothetical protein